TKMPLADQRRRITHFFQLRWQRRMFGWQTHCRVSRTERLLETETQAVLVSSRDQGRARRGTDSRVGVSLQKPYAFGSNAIDVRRFQIGAAITADIGVSEIVRHHINDIRRRRARLPEDIV